VLPGGRVTLEDAYAYGKFARVVLGTNDVDARTRASSDEEQSFLGATVAGTGLGVTFADLEKAPAVLMVSFEPEDEGGVVFLRLKKSADTQQTFTLAPHLSRGADKLGASLVQTVPGYEGTTLASLKGKNEVATALKQPGSVIIVGERAASAPGALTETLALAERTGATVAWIPRRAGERGAVEAGALPGLLPGGADVSVTAARKAMAEAWGVEDVPGKRGRDAARIISAAASKELDALVVGGVTPSDLTADLRKALETAKFVVNLEVRRTEVSEHADVVFPVAPPSEKSGTFVNWEGRLRGFTTAIKTDAISDHRVLDSIAREMGTDLGTATLEAISEQLTALSAVTDQWRHDAPSVAPPAKDKETKAASVGARATSLVLASWHQLVDESSLQEGEPHLAGTGLMAVARMSPATAKAVGVKDGLVSLLGAHQGSIELPVVETDMVDGVVWVPTKSPGSWVAQDLGLTPGDTVSVKGGI